MTHDRPVLGIVLMLGFCAVAPLGDAVVKLLGASIDLGQLLIVRFGLQAAILIPLIIVTGRKWQMRGQVVWLTLLRTCLHILGIGMMFKALQYLPLADAVAIAFVMPFIMLLLGHYVLKEEVGQRRLIACTVGFIGTLLVIKPSFAAVGWPALLPLGVAVNFSLFMLVTRKIAKQTDPIGLQAVSGIMAVVLLAPFVMGSEVLGLEAMAWVSPDRYETMLLLSAGVLGTLAHLLMTWSLRHAPSATLAPMQYLEIPFATLLGWMFFAELPDRLATVGVSITIAAGLYILIRERASSVARLARPPQPVRKQAAAG